MCMYVCIPGTPSLIIALHMALLCIVSLPVKATTPCNGGGVHPRETSVPFACKDSYLHNNTPTDVFVSCSFEILHGAYMEDFFVTTNNFIFH